MNMGWWVANKIICCDWGLDVAVAESNLEILMGVKGVYVFPKPSLFIHDHKFLPPSHKRSIYFVHQSDWLWYDDAICGEKSCLP